MAAALDHCWVDAWHLHLGQMVKSISWWKFTLAQPSLVHDNKHPMFKNISFYHLQLLGLPYDYPILSHIIPYYPILSIYYPILSHIIHHISPDFPHLLPSFPSQDVDYRAFLGRFRVAVLGGPAGGQRWAEAQGEARSTIRCFNGNHITSSLGGISSLNSHEISEQRLNSA